MFPQTSRSSVRAAVPVAHLNVSQDGVCSRPNVSSIPFDIIRQGIHATQAGRRLNDPHLTTNASLGDFYGNGFRKMLPLVTSTNTNGT